MRGRQVRLLRDQKERQSPSRNRQPRGSPESSTRFNCWLRGVCSCSCYLWKSKQSTRTQSGR